MALRTYLDTGVLIAAYKANEDISEAAINVIADIRREFFITNYLKLELLPSTIFFKNSDEEEFYELFFHECKLIPTSDKLAQDAVDLAGKYNLGAMDSLHISAAIQAGADEFITNEKPTKPLFQVPGITVKTIHPV